MIARGWTRALLGALLAAVVLLLLAGCTSAGTSGSGGGTTMVEKNFQFAPASLTVQLGDTVTFDNQDTVAHRVVVGAKDLGEQAPGASVTWTADANGTFAVKCLIHPSMTGQITVGAGGGSSAPAGGGSSAPAAPSGGY